MKFRNTLALLLLATGIATVQADDRPNIIIFFTDDHGHADLSCQNVDGVDDVRTPNVDALAKGGVRAIHGYSTAPQCVPSRGGLLVGKFQSRFGLESNASSLDGFNRETTFVERLRRSGYVTAQFGKWHLGDTREITDHGFTYVYAQNSGKAFASNITIDGNDRPMGIYEPDGYHLDACSQAAASIIDRHHDKPFCLYVAYRAPHVPLDAPQKYTRRFPGEMPERRRKALAMLSAVDDGVGLVMKTVKKHRLTKDTLVFYIGDNGAPLKIHQLDDRPGWNGSLNEPLNGEKGMLSEGGIHTPFVVSWPGHIRPGQEYPHAVSTLDVAATSLAVAGIRTRPGQLDGVDLMPYLAGRKRTRPHYTLMWRWIAQSAIRQGKWKLLRGGDREYLYNLEKDLEEQNDVSDKRPKVAANLRRRLSLWADQLSPPGLTEAPMSGKWDRYFDIYLEGREVRRPVENP